MKQRINTTKRTLKIGAKILLLVIIFYTTFSYSIPAYSTVRAYVEEKVLNTSKVILIGETPVIIEIANTTYSRTLGLSGRKELKKGRGMFFVFEKEDTYGFWMRDMNFSIDIIWFNSFGEVIYMKEDIAPSTYPNTFTPDKPALYVLEVPAGFVKSEHIKLGDKVDFY